MSDLIAELTVERLRDFIHQAGYRAEAVTDPNSSSPVLRSATGGIAFDIRPGNRSAGGDGFVDLVLITGLQVEGELPLDLVNRWNAQRRFARLHLNPGALLLTMDVSVLGGVSPAYLRGQIEIWDRLVPDLVTYLREELGRPTPGAGRPAVEPAAGRPRADAASAG